MSTVNNNYNQSIGFAAPQSSSGAPSNPSINITTQGANDQNNPFS